MAASWRSSWRPPTDSTHLEPHQRMALGINKHPWTERRWRKPPLKAYFIFWTTVQTRKTPGTKPYLGYCLYLLVHHPQVGANGVKEGGFYHLKSWSPLSPGVTVQGCRWWREKRAQRRSPFARALIKGAVSLHSSRGCWGWAARAKAAAFGPLNSHADGSIFSAEGENSPFGKLDRSPLTFLNFSLTQFIRKNNTDLTGLLRGLDEMIMESETLRGWHSGLIIAWLWCQLTSLLSMTVHQKHLLSSCWK